MDRVGETLERLRALLTERGAVVIGSQEFRSAMSYLPYRKRGFGNPDNLPGEAELEGARRFGAAVVRPFELEPIPPQPVSVATRYKARLLASRKFRRSFFPNPELQLPQCTGYGSCISRCLFEALERIDDEPIPIVSDHCIQCLECIANCPREGLAVDSALKELISTMSYRLGIH
jgi:ferredoxin